MTVPTVATVWDWERLAALAEDVESKIANLGSVADLRPAYQAGLLVDAATARAWMDVAPAAARRRFGDCKEVNDLQALAAADLVGLIAPR
jgi:hypothetical protein